MYYLKFHGWDIKCPDNMEPHGVKQVWNTWILTWFGCFDSYFLFYFVVVPCCHILLPAHLCSVCLLCSCAPPPLLLPSPLHLHLIPSLYLSLCCSLALCMFVCFPSVHLLCIPAPRVFPYSRFVPHGFLVCPQFLYCFGIFLCLPFWDISSLKLTFWSMVQQLKVM